MSWIWFEWDGAGHKFDARERERERERERKRERWWFCFLGFIMEGGQGKTPRETGILQEGLPVVGWSVVLGGSSGEPDKITSDIFTKFTAL